MTTLIRVWEDPVKPGVAVSYAGTMMKLKPELLTQEVRDAVDRVRQKASVLYTRRAVPIPQEQMNMALVSAPDSVARAIILMWLSASRHKDILRVHQIQAACIFRGVVLLQWAAFKSDRYGLRAVSKFIFIPKRFRSLFKNWDVGTHQQSVSTPQEHIQESDSALFKARSMHPTCRGGILNAGNWNVDEMWICCGSVMGHTPTADSHLAVRRYVEPSENQPEAQMQLKMSRKLASSIQ